MAQLQTVGNYGAKLMSRVALTSLKNDLTSLWAVSGQVHKAAQS